MDKFITLASSSKELGIHDDDLLSIASEGDITLTWRPLGCIELYYVDTSESEPQYVDYSTCLGPKSVVRSGYFDIDLALCPSWKKPLNDIRCGGLGYGDVFEPIDPLAVREIGPDDYVWSVTSPPELDTGKKLDFPTRETLGVFRKELDRYKNQLKRTKDLPEKNGINKQRTRAYKKYLDETNQWHRLNDKHLAGKKGFKNEVFEALKYEKANDGTDLFTKKADMKDSWEELKSTHKNKT